MTNKEAIEILDQITAIKALEELCDDCISRSKALSVFRPKGITEDVWKECDIYKKLTALSSVTPQPKIGRWIKTVSENGVTLAVRCSECRFEDNRYMLFRYCPNCGARMEVEE